MLWRLLIDSTDARGRILEEILVEYDLCSANRGSVPTCTAGSNGSVIDFTFVNNESENRITNWRVTKQDSFSDHRIITFKTEAQKPETVLL